jgi:hypothetical protein
MGVKLTKGLSVQVDVPFGGHSVRVKMFGGRSVGGRSIKAPKFFTDTSDCIGQYWTYYDTDTELMTVQ